MFKIESLLSKHLVSVLGVLVAGFTLIANVGCAGVTAAPNSNSASSVSVQVTPSTASLQPGSAQQFSATVTGGSSSGVTWSATGGTVSSTGLYTAPATPGTYTVQATSTADTSKSGSATITVLGSSTTPQISFSPAQLSFGTVAVNTTTTQNLRIANVGVGTLTVSQLNFTGDNVFTVNGATFPLSIASGKSANVPIVFAPVASGSFTASLTASSNANNSSSTVDLIRHCRYFRIRPLGGAQLEREHVQRDWIHGISWNCFRRTIYPAHHECGSGDNLHRHQRPKRINLLLRCNFR